MTTTKVDTRNVCPINGCETSVRLGVLMCRPHWGAVPRDLQQRVYRTYRIWLRDMGNADKMREYRAAAKDAIEAV